VIRALGAETVMKRVCYSVAMSLDGYIADRDGGAGWIVMDPEVDFAALFARFDTALIGRRTFEAARAQGMGVMPGLRTVVVSRTLRPEDCPGVTVIGEGLGDAVARLRDAPGKDVWLFGGGSLFRSLLDLGLVDEVQVAVIPVLLGGGTPLLPPPSSQPTRLRLKNHRLYQTTGIVLLEYEVEKPAP
jgi:dihydrofolate reductase